jgi:hypothetical protein
MANRIPTPYNPTTRIDLTIRGLVSPEYAALLDALTLRPGLSIDASVYDDPDAPTESQLLAPTISVDEAFDRLRSQGFAVDDRPLTDDDAPDLAHTQDGLTLEQTARLLLEHDTGTAHIYAPTREQAIAYMRALIPHLQAQTDRGIVQRGGRATPGGEVVVVMGRMLGESLMIRPLWELLIPSTRSTAGLYLAGPAKHTEYARGLISEAHRGGYKLARIAPTEEAESSTAPVVTEVPNPAVMTSGVRHLTLQEAARDIAGKPSGTAHLFSESRERAVDALRALVALLPNHTTRGVVHRSSASYGSESNEVRIGYGEQTVVIRPEWPGSIRSSMQPTAGLYLVDRIDDSTRSTDDVIDAARENGYTVTRITDTSTERSAS